MNRYAKTFKKFTRRRHFILILFVRKQRVLCACNNGSSNLRLRPLVGKWEDECHIQLQETQRFMKMDFDSEATWNMFSKFSMCEAHWHTNWIHVSAFSFKTCFHVLSSARLVKHEKQTVQNTSQTHLFRELLVVRGWRLRCWIAPFQHAEWWPCDVLFRKCWDMVTATHIERYIMIFREYVSVGNRKSVLSVQETYKGKNTPRTLGKQHNY